MSDAQPGKVVTFYSYKGGCGRTMALANVAWILASRGKRVLAVDWDLESPGLHSYFRPFLDNSIVSFNPGVIDMVTDYVWAAVGVRERPAGWQRQYARVGVHAVSVEWPNWPGEGTLDYLSAGRLNRDYSSTVSAFDWDNFYDRLGGGLFLDAMRAEMKETYDYVLVDSRTGLNDISDICTGHLPDVLVACFALNDQSIDGVASVARQIDSRHGNRRIRILPVPMRTEEAEKEKLDISRSFARVKFSGFPSDMDAEQLKAYWPSVEIPYKPFYAFEETLATFGDEPGSPTTLLAAYERLTAAITADEVKALKPMTPADRLANLARFARRRIPAPTKVLLTYVPSDRMWADWIEAVLVASGVEVQRQTVTSDSNIDAVRPGEGPSHRTMAVLTHAYVHSVADLGQFGFPTPERTFLPILVGDLASIPPGWERSIVNLSGLTRDDAILALLRAVDLPPRLPANLSDNEVRFPGNRPRVSNLPGRNTAFVGRADLLEKLRDELVGVGQAVVLPRALHGMGGVGKTQVALEYAYRFMADYDLIWWVAAEDVDQISPQLARLAGHVGVPRSENVTETAYSVLEKLRAGEVFTRWLLIFDNASEPSDFEPFLLGGIGHVLVTSFNQDWSRVASTLEVDVFDRNESIEQLRGAVLGLSWENANKIASALGDLPLAIEQAGAWLQNSGMLPETYLEELDRQAVRLLENQASGFPESVVSTWRLSFERLMERSPASAQLLRLLAFFSPGPISTLLIYSEAMLNALAPLDKSLREVIVLGRLIQELNRFALVKVDQRSKSLRIHRLVQAVIRSQMSEEERRTASLDVQSVLVAARPAPTDAPARLHVDDLDDPANWSRYDLIWPHLRPSGAMESDAEPVRQLLIEWVRYEWKRGDFEAALRLGLELEKRWSAVFDTNDRQTLFLGFHIANVLRSLGRYEKSYEWDSRVLRRQQEVLEGDHPATLMTAGGLAADHRARGHFEEALKLDLDTYSRLKSLLGVDNPRTLAAANNLAVSLRLNGDSRSAEARDQNTLARRKQVLGDTHPYTLSSAANLARDLRESGRYDESIGLLRSTYGTYCEVMGPEALETLRTANSLAASLRKAGQFAEAMEITEGTLTLYVEQHDAQSPDALACRLSLAADYAALGEFGRSREFTSTALSAYRTGLGEEHPYTLAAANNLVIYLRNDGSHHEALILADSTLRPLERNPGVEHPFTMACAVNRANCLLVQGQFSSAEEILREILSRMQARLPTNHPDTLACEVNLAVTLRESGQTDEAMRIREPLLVKLTDQLGAEHPMTRALKQSRCIDIDLEPQPV